MVIFNNLLPPYSPKVWKAIGLCLIGLVIIAILLFASDRISNWWNSRGIDKAKANVNAALEAVNAQRSVVATDRVDEALALQNVNVAVKGVIEASNATDAAKQAANEALAKYENAHRANVPVGTSEEILREKLRALDE